MKKKNQDDVLMNEDIRFKEVRCNGEDGTSYGVISSFEAQKLAEEAGLDLVLSISIVSEDILYNHYDIGLVISESFH